MSTICKLLLNLIIVAALAACEGSHDNASPPSASLSTGTTDFSSPAAALRMAETMRTSGTPDQALAVLAAAHRQFPDDPAVTSAYGRQALMNGQDALAARLLKEAAAGGRQDWRVLSAQGVLDSRDGRLAEARDSLARARTASGEEASVLNNLAVSYLLERNPTEAAALLRQALASPLLKSAYQRRIQRNLALALAMLGNFEEADALAGERLPRSLHHASQSTIRRFIGMGGASSPQSETLVALDGGSWRAVETLVSP